MVRIVFIGLVVIMAWLAVMQIWKLSREGRIDWTGVSFAVGFVVLAFYLRHATGMG